LTNCRKKTSRRDFISTALLTHKACLCICAAKL